MREGAYMTEKEVKRVEIFARISHGHITKTKAAEELNLSLRQVLRLYKDFRKEGREALRSKRRGKPSNNQLPQEIRTSAIDLMARDAYEGFKPKFMSEKLKELHNIFISKETARQLMIESGVWIPKSKKRPVAHQRRQRRNRYGELIQIDGSHHHWFEDRGAACTLLVYIDDATGRTFGKFADHESTDSYMDATRDYITKFGKPRTFYSDKYSVFRINRTSCLKDELQTQFGRALKELDIGIICANSPQAKGRVERANRTLQDRLVKELRLANISTIEEANKFLETYWDKHNGLFSVKATSSENAHRTLSCVESLEDVLCVKCKRKLSKNFELQFKNVIYQIDKVDQSWGVKNASVTVFEKPEGKIEIEYKERKLKFKKLCEQEYVGQEVPSKEIDRFLRGPSERKVSKNHPWRGRCVA